MKIIIVEDELIAAEYLKEILLSHNFDVIDIIDNSKDALSKIPLLQPDIVLMDIMIKGNLSGSEVALRLKQDAKDTAIIFLTAYADEEMLEYAMQSNCFGYLMKPYNETEIINTLKVVFVRTNEKPKSMAKKPKTIIHINDKYSFDLKHNILLKENREFYLSPNSIKVLEILAKNANSTVSQEQISLHVWGKAQNSITLRTQIHRIKEKLGENIIQSVSGAGYTIKTKNLE